MIKLEQLFDYVVTPTGCWECVGGLRPEVKLAGSGRKFVGKKLAALICESFRGPKPSEDHHAAHTCHNKACINEEHIEWQTSFQNLARKDGDHFLVDMEGSWRVLIKRKSGRHSFNCLDKNEAIAWRDAKLAELANV